MQKVGFIGLGVMGKPMALRLLNSGYTLAVYNRTREKADELVHLGASSVSSPSELAKSANVIISMVTDSKALEEISTGKDGVINGMRSGDIHIDMSTVSPELTERLYFEYKSRDMFFLHAPVLGSKRQASDGTLLIFVGGDESAYRRCKDIFRVLGTKTWHFKEIRQAGYLKLVMNSMIAGMISIFSQAIVLGMKAGLTMELILDVLGNSALDSRMYQSKGKTIMDGDFTPNFYLKHLLKDINLMLEAGERLKVPLPLLSVIRELIVVGCDRGYEMEDYSVIFKVFQEMAGLK
jgi:3-hydroxyisobutyrate dehydrogenase-like beta-hydroxyacid dehydrogenase